MDPFQTEPYGRFYLVDKVATGGMAEVFKAKSFSHGGFEKLLVIKRILGHLSENEEFVEMFIDEAKITVSLQHPNIVQIYDFGRILQNYFLSMECVEGKDVKGILRKLAHRRKLLPTEFAVYIAHEMTKGLDYAHKKCDEKGSPLRIIHRDISPSNILVSYNGEVKIADFGIAKAESSAFTTKDGVLKGKFEYMSPEQASGGELDGRSDIFSAGIILHEMLTGRRLFKTDSDLKTLEKIKAVDISPPSALNPNIPARLDEIVMRALARDPIDRFQDAREMQQSLLEFMYPATPDLTRESLSHFMQELFSQEIDEERLRLNEGTRVAAQLYATEPHTDSMEWHAAQQTTAGTLSTPRPSRWPMALAVGAILALGSTLAWMILGPKPPETVAQAATTGAIIVRVSPPEAGALVFLGAEQIGSGGEVLREGVPGGAAQELRVVAEGYQEWKETVTVEAGERLRQQVVLLPLVPDAAEQVPGTGTVAVEVQAPAGSDTETARAQVEAATVTARFSSDPPGATVSVDGSTVGTTPLSWAQGTPGRAYQVRMSLDGYESASFSATMPGTGSKAFSGTLVKKEAAPGTLKVFSARPGEVFVNGKSWGETPPPVSREVPAGTYSIEIRHTDGTTSSLSKVVESGQAVTARP